MNGTGPAGDDLCIPPLSEKQRAAVLARASKPVTLRELRAVCIGMQRASEMPNQMKRSLESLVKSGELKRYGVRNCFDTGTEELFIRNA